MIKKIVKHTARTKQSIQYLLNYEVHGEDGEFGFIGLRPNGEVIFKFVGIEYDSLDFGEIEIIHHFMHQLYQIHFGDELNTLRDEYYYNEPRPTQGTDKTG